MNTTKILTLSVIAVLYWACTDKTPLGIDQLNIDDPDGIPPVLTNIQQIGDSVRVTWIDNINNESGFRIFRKVKNGNYTQISDVSPNTFYYTDKSTLQDETTYFYYVETYGANSSQSSNEKQITFSDVQGIFVDFEDGQLPDGWSATRFDSYGNGPYGGGWSVSSSADYEGNYGIATPSTYYYTFYLTATISVPQDTEVTISFYTSEPANSGDGYLYINGENYLDWDYNSPSWDYESVSYNTGSNTEIELMWRYYSYNYGYAYIDNIQVTW
ncbi:MAG: hypothetical protein HOC41_01670 [Candidatus Marinimicrobia bacterium]|jgi:hypothetical protein|nr:hypothetical protein [Candidatus Neomarinimicrobiota bacterium]MBT3945003.1 hypothetical protein [Candidatus Neomarinimicrobiota bacterium]MBT4155577.1 hypothetical protein [Candidatus Neomarinimicrobiota bacterium]MBT4554374.1 hypothetical protein [Candidatus Neomarinimicrobiota bacterium]MBT4753897.1 hypothetical protein [Candidatus Neomarinimicrobiota bacterium]